MHDDDFIEIQNLILGTFTSQEALESFLDFVNDEGCTEPVAEFLNQIYE